MDSANVVLASEVSFQNVLSEGYKASTMAAVESYIILLSKNIFLP